MPLVGAGLRLPGGEGFFEENVFSLHLKVAIVTFSNVSVSIQLLLFKFVDAWPN